MHLLQWFHLVTVGGAVAMGLACASGDPGIDPGDDPASADEVAAGQVVVEDRHGNRRLYDRASEAVVASGQPRRLTEASGRVYRFELDAAADLVISVGGGAEAAAAALAQPAGYATLADGRTVERLELLPDPESLDPGNVPFWRHTAARGLAAGTYHLVVAPRSTTAADLTVVLDPRPPAPATSRIVPIPIEGTYAIAGWRVVGRSEPEAAASPLPFRLDHSGTCLVAPAVADRVPLDCYRLDVPTTGNLTDSVSLPAGVYEIEVHPWGAQLEATARTAAGAEVPVKLMFVSSRTTLHAILLSISDPARADRLFELTVSPTGD